MRRLLCFAATKGFYAQPRQTGIGAFLIGDHFPEPHYLTGGFLFAFAGHMHVDRRGFQSDFLARQEWQRTEQHIAARRVLKHEEEYWSMVRAPVRVATIFKRGNMAQALVHEEVIIRNEER